MSEAGQVEEDALKTLEELKASASAISLLRNDLASIERILQSLDQKTALDQKDIDNLSIETLSPTTLRFRVKGIERVKITAYSSQLTKHNELLQLLTKLKKCSTCLGQGTIAKNVYERSDGRVTPVTTIEQCSQCGGTGRAKLDEKIVARIDSALQDYNPARVVVLREHVLL